MNRAQRTNKPYDAAISLSSPSHVPSLMHACSEARVVASKYYTLGLATLLNPAQIYIDFTMVTIYFTEPFRDTLRP